MSNTNNPHGCWPLGTSLSGGPQTIDYFNKAAADDKSISRNDPVNRAGGYITATATAGTTPFHGVALNYGAASKLTEHAVIVSPDALYECQLDNTALGATDLGKMANFTLAVGTGDANTHISKAVINGGSADASTATLDVKLLALYPVPNNVIGAYCRLEIVFNKHRMGLGVVGA